jgi:thiamine biosynthesis lipoprotein
VNGPCHEVRRARPLLGTLVEIGATGADSFERLHAAVSAAFARIERIHALLSYQDPRSELTRLNRCAALRAQRVDPHTYRVLEAALSFAELSDGAFDPCVAAGSWRDVELLTARRVRFRRHARLDLGGIAKGYAVDLALEALRNAGVRTACVNAGGDLRVSGTCARRIALRHPSAPGLTAHTLLLRDGAVATSAAYHSRRRQGSREVSHLLDPRTHRPLLDRRSVSVCARDCMSADALTKVVLFAAPDIAERALAACEAHAYVQH